MKVDYASATIHKPAGKRTPERTIAFAELVPCIEIYKKVVDVQSPTEAVASWVASGFDEQQVVHVLRAVVVQFGGGHRIWGQYHQEWETSPHDINEILSEVHRRREENAGELRPVLRRIRGLGGPSYSTKILRFMSPKHVVLDSVLREECGMTEADYDKFAYDCCRIGEILGVVPVDVESGLYALVQLANPNQRCGDWKAYQ